MSELAFHPCKLLSVGVKKIDPSIYEDMKNHEFGEEHISEIFLCSIREKQSDGFYRVEASMKLHDKI